AVLEQLAAQAAISLESATLYAELADHRRTLEHTVEQRTAELERSRALLQTIVDSSTALLSLKALDGRYLMTNRQLAAAVGRPGQSLVGLSAEDIVGAELVRYWKEQDQVVISENRTVRFEADISLNGNARTFQMDKFPVHDASGQIYAIGTISFDITELKRI